MLLGVLLRLPVILRLRLVVLRMNTLDFVTNEVATVVGYLLVGLLQRGLGDIKLVLTRLWPARARG